MSKEKISNLFVFWLGAIDNSEESFNLLGSDVWTRVICTVNEDHLIIFRYDHDDAWFRRIAFLNRIFERRAKLFGLRNDKKGEVNFQHSLGHMIVPINQIMACEFERVLGGQYNRTRHLVKLTLDRITTINGSNESNLLFLEAFEPLIEAGTTVASRVESETLQDVISAYMKGSIPEYHTNIYRRAFTHRYSQVDCSLSKWDPYVHCRKYKKRPEIKNFQYQNQNKWLIPLTILLGILAFYVSRLIYNDPRSDLIFVFVFVAMYLPLPLIILYNFSMKRITNRKLQELREAASLK